MGLKWNEIIKGDWLYNNNTKRFHRVIDIIGLGPNTITLVPLLDISKRIIINQGTYEKYSFSKAFLNYTASKNEPYFSIMGAGIQDVPVILKDMKPSLSLPKELHIIDIKTPMSPPGVNGHATDAVRYSTMAAPSVGAVHNINPHMACKHEWRGTQLFFSTVYDCIKCGKKKEDA